MENENEYSSLSGWLFLLVLTLMLSLATIAVSTFIGIINGKTYWNINRRGG